MTIGLFRVAAFKFLLVFLSMHAVAQERITITEGRVEPLNLAIAPFSGAGESETDFARRITRVVQADLERSGLFRAIDPNAFISLPESPYVQPQFTNWRAINAQALVVGRALTDDSGQLRVEFRLWDTFVEQDLIGQAFFGAPESWRRIAHKISDAIYERLTGEQGYFDTRIVYVAEMGDPLNRTRRLAIMDQDGENHSFLTDGRNMVFSPRFSPTGDSIAYLAFRNDSARVYLQDIDSGELEVLGDFSGMTFAPRFSPDGNKVVMSHALAGNTEIYAMDLRTREAVRLTQNADIDVSPSYSPDGARIVFQSDRSGSPQLYIMDSDGGDSRRISFGVGSYYAPVWSPRGDLIAFIKQTKGRFYIGVMRLDGSNERLLASGYHVDTPTWSSNGRVLIFARQSIDGPQGDRVGLYSIDLTGYNERMIPTPGDASDPAWSPLIP